MSVNTKKDIKVRIMNKVVAMMLVITLTIANFILIAKETYAILVEDVLTSQIPVEGITTKITNEVEKYIKVEEGVLLQVELNINLQKQDEQTITEGKIEIDVPKINNVVPTKTKLVNITTGYKSNYSLSGKLTITPNDIIGETRYKIVYMYPEAVWEEGTAKEITWTTTVSAYVDSQEYMMKNTENAVISNIGSAISTEVSITEEIYKGRMLIVEGQNETEYTQTIEVETSYLNENQPVNLTLNPGTPQIINKDESRTTAKTYYKSTKISKNRLSAIFADDKGDFELKITSVDEAGQRTETILGKNTPTEAEGSTYILVSYPAKTTSIQIESTSNIKTESYGLEIKNEKVLITDKSIDNIGAFDRLEEIVNTNGIEAMGAMKFVEPTSNATIALKDRDTITAIDRVQNIQLVITLLTNSTEKDQLFENPTFKIKMPDGVTIKDVEKNISISAENGNFTVKDIRINENNEIYLEIQGKQTNYISSEINTQIIVNTSVEVSKMIANKADTIKMEYTNKDETKQVKSSSIKILASNDKIVSNLKITNYDGKGSILEKYSDNQSEIKGKLPILNGKVVVPISYTIINNYPVQIAAVNSIVANFTDYNREETNLMNWYEENVVVDAGQIKTIERTLEIPANLYYNEKIDINAFTTYNYLGTEYDFRNNLKLATEQKDAIGNIEIVDGKFMIDALAQLGDGTILSNNDEVYNEQIVKYTMRITNITNETMTNVVVNARQENGKIYDLKEVTVTNPMLQEGEFIEHRYGELDTDTKTFTIASLAPNETQELIYRAVMKKTAEGENSKSNVSIKADSIAETTATTITNPIKSSDIKIVTELSYNQEVEIHTNSAIQILINIENLTNTNLTNKKVRIYLSDGLTWESNISEVLAYDTYYDEEIQGTIYEQLDILDSITYNKEGNYVEFNVEDLRANKEIVVISTLYIKEIPIEQIETIEGVYAKIDDNVSNKVEINALQSKTQVTVKQSVNVSENKKVKDNENIAITAEISNTGNIGSSITIQDSLNRGLEIQKVTLVKNGQNEDRTENSTNGIINIVTDINARETIKVIIEAKVRTINITGKEITNIVYVTLNGGEKVESNTITLQIESEFVDSGEGDPKGLYSISGVAWLDRNNNQVKDQGEGLSGVIVKLIDLDNQNSFVKDKNGNEIEVKTNNQGEYTIPDVATGNYNVIFKYDTSVYELKENSNVKDYILNRNDKEEKVAITNNINLTGNKANVDLELILLKKFDLKLDKYITKVIARTSKDTRTTKYVDQKLVREEISNKYIAGSTVLVEYTIRITNVGELPGYATEIIDYLPEGMQFSSELNTQWYINSDGNLYNNSLAGEIINPGESKDITLILVKNLTSEDTGKTTNIAKISATTNSREYIDSNLNNDESSAEMIINPATGEVFTYILVIANSIITVLAGVIIIKKKVIK